MPHAPWTRLHLDLDAVKGLASPSRALDSRGVALGFVRLPAGEGYTFTHHHEEQEEVYVVLAGRGTLLVGGELLPLERGDLVRVAPEARRALRAADDEALLVICAGGVPAGYPREPEGRYLIDDGVPHYDDVPPWYAGDPAVRAKNAALAERMESARRRRAEGGGAR
jgi:hypothetical protein